MNAGLGNIKTLKAHLLAEALREDTAYDSQLLLIGLGTAAAFEGYCDRKFAWAEDDTFTCSADRTFVYLPRYPVTAITTVELKTALTWETQTGLIQSWNDYTGHVYWGGEAGPDYAQLRFTFTGGYWFDTTADDSGVMPDDATALPSDLKLAWVMQCRQAWQSVDKLGVDILKTGSSSQFVTGSLSNLDLIPDVKNILDGYRRFQML
jgi:hypothetical protein